MVSFPFNHCSRLCIAILELTKIIQFGSMDFRVVNGIQRDASWCITLCFKDAEMIWARPHISIVKISALKVHSNTLFYRVQTISGSWLMITNWVVTDCPGEEVVWTFSNRALWLKHVVSGLGPGHGVLNHQYFVDFQLLVERSKTHLFVKENVSSVLKAGFAYVWKTIWVEGRESCVL